MHTGDVSQGTAVGEGQAGKNAARDSCDCLVGDGRLFVNDTIYVSTPFYRILAVEPDTGKLKWQFNPHAKLEA